MFARFIEGSALFRGFHFGSATLGFLLASHVAFAGSLTPSGPPASTMKTLSDVEPRTAINTLPTTISVSGSYYLAQKLTGVSGQNGIVIAADGVSVDLNGFSLVGVTGSLNGILSAGAHWNIRISNGAISNWSSCGADISSTSNSIVSELRVSSNGHHGIIGGYSARIADSCAEGNKAVGISSGDSAIVSRCVANYNGTNGIAVGWTALVEDCVASYNGSTDTNAGIYVGGLNACVRNCLCSSNPSNGILVAADHVRIQNNTVAANTSSLFSAVGIKVGVVAGTHVCTVEGNNITGNNIGVSVKSPPAGTSGNFIVRNIFAQNNMVSSIDSNNSYGQFIDVKNVGQFTSTDPQANILY